MSFDRFDRVVASSFFASAVLWERRGPRLAGITVQSKGEVSICVTLLNKTNGCYEAPSPIIVDSLFMAESPNL
jgi:hypothetical protein